MAIIDHMFFFCNGLRCWIGAVDGLEGRPLERDGGDVVFDCAELSRSRAKARERNRTLPPDRRSAQLKRFEQRTPARMRETTSNLVEATTHRVIPAAWRATACSRGK